MAERQLPELRSRLRLDTTDLDRAKAKSALLTRTLGSTKISTASLDAFALKANKLGSTLTRNITVPIAAIGGAAVKLALDFDAAFTKIATLSNAPTSAIDDLRAKVLDLAHATGQSPKALANALLVIERSGVGSAHAIDVLTASARGAALGLGDVSDIANTVTAAMHAYGPSVLSAGTAMDVLVAATKEGKADISEFGPQLGRLLPIAKNLHISFGQVAGALAFLSQGGGGTSQGGAQLFVVLSKLEKLTPAAAKALDKVGISAGDVRSSLDQNGLIGTLQLLEQKLGGTPQALAKVVGGGRALAGILALMGDGGKGAAAGIDQVNNSVGVTDLALEKLNKSDPQKAKVALADLEVAAIKLGQKLLPALVDVAGAVAGVASAFASLPKWAQEGIIGLALFAAAMGPVIKTFGLGAKAVSGLMKAANSKALDGFRLGLQGLTEEGAGAGNALGGFIASAGGMAAVLPVAAGAVGILAAAYVTLSGASKRATDNVKKLEEAAQADGGSIIRGFKQTLSNTLSGTENGFELDISGSRFRKGFKEAGVSAKQLSDLLLGSRKDFDAFTTGLYRKQNADITAFASQLRRLRGSADDANAHSRLLTENNKALGLETKGAAGATADLGAASDRTAGALGHESKAMADLASHGPAATHAIVGLAQAAKDAFDAHMTETDAIQAVSQAQTDLDAARAAAAPGSDQMVQATRAIADAEKGVADAKKASLNAEQALTDARKQAARDLVNLKNAAIDAALAEKGAELDLAEAKRKVAEGNFDSPIDKARAELAIQQAAAAVNDAQAKATQAAQDSTSAQAKGVEGSDAVVSAKQQVADAADAERQAQDRLGDSTKALTKLQTDSAAAVKQAQDRLTGAELDLAGAHSNVARASGGIRAANDAMVTSLENIAKTLAPGSELRKNIEAYLADLLLIQAASKPPAALPGGSAPGDVVPGQPLTSHGKPKSLRLNIPAPGARSLVGAAAPSVNIEQHLHVNGNPDDVALAKMKQVAADATREGIRRAGFQPA